MGSTKERIAEKAIFLFNKNGLVNVSIRDIANELNISPGNITYHFKNKVNIIDFIYDIIVEERILLASQLKLIPSFSNINSSLEPLLALFEKYRFFYLDILEVTRAYPKLAEKHREHVRFQIEFIKQQIDYSVNNGNMIPPPREGYYDQLAHTVWVTLSFWMTQQFIRGYEDSDFDNARRAMWDLVIPLLTEKGKSNFGIKGYFDESFTNKYKEKNII